MSVHQRAAHANVVLFLRHLGRDADADLVEPLIAAAVTLDPVHLQESERTESERIISIQPLNLVRFL